MHRAQGRPGNIAHEVGQANGGESAKSGISERRLAIDKSVLRHTLGMLRKGGAI